MRQKISYKILLNILVFIWIGFFSFGQNFQWAKQMGGSIWDLGNSIVTHGDNQVYVIGLFGGTVDFDPGVGVLNLTSVGEKDAFVCKFNADGDLLWAKQYGNGSFIDENGSLAIDATGNLYITNSFVGTVDFDPGPNTFSVTSTWEKTTFIQKLDPHGEFVWVKTIGSDESAQIFPKPVMSNGIAIDSDGNILIGGSFDGEIDFDPDPNASFYMTSTYQLTDAFVCKLNSDGTFIWAKQFSGSTGGALVYGIALDENNNVYTIGTIGGTVDFDPDSGVFNLTPSVTGQTEMFVCKLNDFGDFVWAKQLGPGEGAAVVVDGENNVYTTGWSPSGYMPKIHKMNPQGELIWSNILGQGVSGEAIALGTNGHVFITGYSFGTNDFDPGSNEFILTGGSSDSYISEFDSSGNFIWAGLLTGTSQVVSKSIAVDQENQIYLTGFYDGTADFDPHVSTQFNLSAPNQSYNVFIVKLQSEGSAGFYTNNLENEIQIYPNPTTGLVSVSTWGKSDVEICVLDGKGKEVLMLHNVKEEVTIDLSPYSSGIYIIQFTTEKKVFTEKIMKY